MADVRYIGLWLPDEYNFEIARAQSLIDSNGYATYSEYVAKLQRQIETGGRPVIIVRATADEFRAVMRDRGMKNTQQNRAAVVGIIATALIRAEAAASGGHARAATMTKKQRSDGARAAVNARWARHKKSNPAG